MGLWPRARARRYLILNAIWFHFSGFSVVWVTPDNSAYVLLIGLTIEISMIFAIAGILFAKILPEDQKTKVLGINDHWFLAVGLSIFCVFVDIVLNQWHCSSVSGIYLVDLVMILVFLVGLKWI